MTQETPAPDDCAVNIRRCRHGFFMYPRHDVYVGRSLELYGEYSEDEVMLFRQLVKPGHVVLEAGSNIGTLTVPLAMMATTSGKVIAIEPQRSLFNILCGNLALNGLLNVQPVRAALGAAAGRVSMPILDYNLHENFGSVGIDTPNKGPAEEVPLTTIDDMKLDGLDFLKADVEGSETAVLQGATETIDRFRPILFIENDRQDKSAGLLTLLEQLNYTAWWCLASLFNKKNFNANPNDVFREALPDNTFKQIISINLLCLPQEDSRPIKGMRAVTGPDDWFNHTP